MENIVFQFFIICLLLHFSALYIYIGLCAVFAEYMENKQRTEKNNKKRKGCVELSRSMRTTRFLLLFFDL
jgi:hypothetical protein